MRNLETQELVQKQQDFGSVTRVSVESETDTSPQTAKKPSNLLNLIFQPFQWLQMLCKELNASFVVGVVLVYGLNQGFLSSYFRLVSDYYWKDVQKVKPSTAQFYVGFYYIPWIMKPLWGILTDVFPVLGYRRRPYFVLAGLVGTLSALTISIHAKLPALFALICLTGIAAGVAIADVTIDACIASNSIKHPSLAPDIQSLCGFCTSLGALLGFSTSGMFAQSLGAQGALGILAIPLSLLVVLGFTIYELRTDQKVKGDKAFDKVCAAISSMYRTIKFPQVWKPSLYMYLSLALSISTHEGQFYWYTDPKAGPAFSKEFVGAIYAVGALASLLGVLIYHKILKDYPFRNLLFFAQLLYSFSGMLDLIFVLRWNLMLRIPDYFFVVMEETASRIISRIRWMPMILLSTKLCPLGIEGTFFSLLMCIDNLGSLSSKLGGGLVLHVLNVTQTNFANLWLAVLIRNLLRIATLALIFLVPRADQSDTLLPPDMLTKSLVVSTEAEGLQLITMNEKD